jgi:hypothetical protein
VAVVLASESTTNMNYMENLTQGLVDELLAVVHKYDNTMMLPTALGCLDIVKAQLLQEHMEDDEDE